MITKQELLDKIEQANSNDEYLRIVRKYIIHGIPYVFKDNANRYYDFREQIANHWHVGFQEVLILGSGKLGYSYHKNSVFSDESDIDVAIVNQSLFESFYLEIRNFQYRLESGLETLTSHEKCEYNRFLSYMIKGWMRPDILPAKITGKLSKDEWFSYFKSISYNNNLAGNYKVSAGLFKNFDYMEYYP
ncbi:hypothetical protein [Segatella copri]|uniref:hypothetical protein n=1 Tax=Segatella copri TaxID=165179 RepID=UPI001931E65A|nr:hypothetical protein [Segatella copri]